MPDTGLKNSPLLIKGAIVQLIEDIIGIVPNIIPFQYNPTLLTYQLRTLESVRGGSDATRHPGPQRATIRSEGNLHPRNWSSMPRTIWRTAMSSRCWSA